MTNSGLTKQEIITAYRDCGVRTGDTLMLHSDAIVLSQIAVPDNEEKFQVCFQALKEVVGETGTLILPTFTYSATKSEVFDIDNTPSSVGVFTEFFRQQPEVLRSGDPIFSIAAWGADAGRLVESDPKDAFGPHSLFAELDKSNTWLGCMGCPFVVTMIHYVEQLVDVPYRYKKQFPASVIKHGARSEFTQSYYVRDLDQPSRIDWGAIRKLLSDQHVLRQVPLGRFGLYLVKSTEFVSSTRTMLEKNPTSLLLQS